MHYYNEFDPKAAAWLRALIDEGLIPKGHVDSRSIVAVSPSDLDGFTQCHFFAGIGGWPLALALAGWPEDRPCWTGSCPCQPFSVGNVAHGGGKGKADPRHLLPKFCELISKCGPSVVFGEQVANAIGKGWLDDAFSELENSGYACGAAVLPACAFGAPHERKRLFWLADAGRKGREGHQPLQCVPQSEKAPFSINGDTFAGARRSLDGDFGHLRRSNGVSLQLERDALKGYGNAIVVPVAAEFIAAAMECV